MERAAFPTGESQCWHSVMHESNCCRTKEESPYRKPLLRTKLCLVRDLYVRIKLSTESYPNQASILYQPKTLPATPPNLHTCNKLLYFTICTADHPKDKSIAKRGSISQYALRQSVSGSRTLSPSPLSIQVLKTHQCGVWFQAEPTVSTCRFLYRGDDPLELQSFNLLDSYPYKQCFGVGGTGSDRRSGEASPLALSF